MNCSDKMDIEKLKTEYNDFLTTDSGKQWLNHWQNEIGSDDGRSFGDFLYDFYPEMLPL